MNGRRVSPSFLVNGVIIICVAAIGATMLKADQDTKVKPPKDYDPASLQKVKEFFAKFGKGIEVAGGNNLTCSVVVGWNQSKGCNDGQYILTLPAQHRRHSGRRLSCGNCHGQSALAHKCHCIVLAENSGDYGGRDFSDRVASGCAKMDVAKGPHCQKARADDEWLCVGGCANFFRAALSTQVDQIEVDRFRPGI